MADNIIRCPICELKGVGSKHHLIPVSNGGEDKDIAIVCIQCHRMIHSLFSNTALKKRFNTIKKLKESDRVKIFLTMNSWNGVEDPSIEAKLKMLQR